MEWNENGCLRAGGLRLDVYRGLTVDCARVEGEGFVLLYFGQVGGLEEVDGKGGFVVMRCVLILRFAS